MNDFDAGDSGRRSRPASSSGQLFVGHRDQPRTPADSLGEGFVDIAAGGERRDRVAVGELFHDGEGALADGAGGTEDGESFQMVSRIDLTTQERSSGQSAAAA